MIQVLHRAQQFAQALDIKTFQLDLIFAPSCLLQPRADAVDEKNGIAHYIDPSMVSARRGAAVATQFGAQQRPLTPFDRFHGNGYNPPMPEPYARPLGNGD
jgi:hypothetical protein